MSFASGYTDNKQNCDKLQNLQHESVLSFKYNLAIAKRQQYPPTPSP
jgi:hypothetical protein